MSCDTCQSLQPVVACFTNLTIGTTTHLSTALKVYVENLATGKITVFDVTSTGGGEIVISGFTWLPNVAFKIWATLVNQTSIDDTIIITLIDGVTTMSCGTFTPRAVFDSTGARESVKGQKLIKV